MTHPVTAWLEGDTQRSLEEDEVVKTASMKLPMMTDRQVEAFYKLALMVEMEKEAIGAGGLKQFAPSMITGAIGGGAIGAATSKDDPMGSAAKGALLGAAGGAGVKYMGMQAAAKASKKAAEKAAKTPITADRIYRANQPMRGAPSNYAYAPSKQNQEAADLLAARTGGTVRKTRGMFGPKWQVNTDKSLKGADIPGVNARQGWWHGRVATSNMEGSTLSKLAAAYVDGYEIQNPVIRAEVEALLKEAGVFGAMGRAAKAIARPPIPKTPSVVFGAKGAGRTVGGGRLGRFATGGSRSVDNSMAAARAKVIGPNRGAQTSTDVLPFASKPTKPYTGQGRLSQWATGGRRSPAQGVSAKTLGPRGTKSGAPKAAVDARGQFKGVKRADPNKVYVGPASGSEAIALQSVTR